MNKSHYKKGIAGALVLIVLSALATGMFGYKIYQKNQNVGAGGGTVGVLPYRVKVSSDDTTGGYLNGKLLAGSNITLTEGLDGLDETLTIASSGGGGGGSPGGSNTQVQFNDSSAFGGDAGMTYVKATDILTLVGGIVIGSSNPFSDSAGTLTLQNVDALDATSETTIEAAIDTLANLTSIQGKTVTLGGNFITSGASSLTLTTTGATNVTLPTTGTLATLAGVETLSNKTLDEAKIVNAGSLKDGNGNELFIFTTTASAINELTFANAAAGNAPKFTASGGDTDISINLVPKGTGRLQVAGVSVPTISSTDTFTNKTIDSDSNTLSVDPDEFKSADSPADEECYTYESTGTTGEWQTCGGGGGTPGGSVNEIQWNNAGSFDGIEGSAITSNGYMTLAPTASTSGSPTLLTLTAPAHTTLAASTEATDVYFNLGRTVQFATGALTTQRAVRIPGPTYSFAGASTITSAQTVNIGVPVAGTNATITNNYGLVVGTPSDFINTIANFGGPLNAFYDINMQNTSNGTLASSDVTASSDNATNGTNFVDMGITSSGFTDSAYTAWGGANSAYLFSESASLNFATQRASAAMNWFTGGTLTANKRMSLSGTASTLTIGVAGSALGSLALAGNTSGTATIVPTAAAGSVTITIPAITSTMALLSGTQTFDGSKTFSATLTVSGAQIQNIRNSLGTNITAGTTVANTTTSPSAGNVQISPYLAWSGTAASAAPASQSVVFYSYSKGIAGTTPVTGNLTFGSNINAAGNTDVMFLSDTGKLGLVNIATAFLDAPASTTAAASFRIRAGTAPTSPNEGDMWADSTQKANMSFTAGVTQSRPGVLFTQTADASVTTTTTETTILGTGVGTKTLPANFWTVGKTVRITVTYSDIDTDAVPGTWTVRGKFGSTTVVSHAGTPTAAQSNGAGDVIIEITCRSTGASGTLSGYVKSVYGYTGVSTFIGSTNPTTTVDTTASGALDVTIQFGNANAGNNLKSIISSIEVLN